jgi:hypothetical protein
MFLKIPNCWKRENEFILTETLESCVSAKSQSLSKNKELLIFYKQLSVCWLRSNNIMLNNGLQYDQWRSAGDIPVNRYKTWRGAESFQATSEPAIGYIAC